MSEQMMFAVLQSESVADISINKLVVNKNSPFSTNSRFRYNYNVKHIVLSDCGFCKQNLKSEAFTMCSYSYIS